MAKAELTVKLQSRIKHKYLFNIGTWFIQLNSPIFGYNGSMILFSKWLKFCKFQCRVITPKKGKWQDIKVGT